VTSSPSCPIRSRTAGPLATIGLLAFTILALGSAVPARSQALNPLILESNPDSALTVALAQIVGTPLTLAEATAGALDQATDVRNARGALMAARGEMRSEKGAFDPELFAEVSHAEGDTPTASPFSGASVLRTKQSLASGGARVTLPIGTELSASLETSKLETNSGFAGVNPQYDASAALTFRQPLLKGFGPAAWGAKKAATRRYEAARARYNDVAQRVRTVVEQTYWDLYAAERDLAVQRILRDRAAAFLDQAEKRGKAGIVGPTVVANARVFLSEQEQALLDREESYDQVSDRLASLIGRRAGVSGSARYRPVDNPPHDFAVEDEDSVVARAMSRNHALAAAERDVASARAHAAEARWNAYPQLDLFGSIGGSGLAGRGRDIVFGGDTLRTNITGTRGDAASDAIDRNFPNWSFGARVTVPIGFRQGAGDHERAKGELEQAEQRYLAARRTLDENVRAAHRELVHSVKRLEAARMGVDAALEQARVGLLEYGLGRTTSFDLVRLGADVASSQQRFSQALVRTAKAVAQLRWLTSSGDSDVTSTGKTTP
jgi:outer membrane protein TolC